MNLSQDYKVDFGRIARTIIYEDPQGSITFTIDLSGKGDKGIFLEGRIEKGAPPDKQARRDMAFGRTMRYLISCGYEVEDPTLLDMRKVKKAVILAAGKGTRMGELTENLPKPMLPVDGKPVLEHILVGLRDEAKIRDFFIVIGWRGQVIKDHFGDGSKWGVSVTYGEQLIQDGTGKAPELAKAWVGDAPFIFTYGDILIRPPTDYALLVDAFNEDGVLAVTVKNAEELSKGGAVVLNEDGFMVDLVEKVPAAQVPPNAFYNAGIYLLTSQIFKYTATLEKSPRGEYEFTDALKATVRAGAKLRGVTLRREWADVRDPAVLAELNSRPR